MRPLHWPYKKIVLPPDSPSLNLKTLPYSRTLSVWELGSIVVEAGGSVGSSSDAGPVLGITNSLSDCCFCLFFFFFFCFFFVGIRIFAGTSQNIHMA